MRRLGAVSLLAACALAAPGAAIAAPATREAALEQYRAVVEDEKVDAGWTGSVEGCRVGEESQDSLTATLRTVNTLRSFAGIGPVSFDPTLNHRALSAALMMKAAGKLSHTPGPDWPCYSFEGDAGAGQSNLFLGASGATAMVGYVDDFGVASLGHRRWLLDPAALQFGSGSTGTTNALAVMGGPATPVAPATVVSWPPPGWVPWPWIFKTWSVALGGELDAGSFSTDGAQVDVLLDGERLAVSNVGTLEDGYGTGRTMSFDVVVPAKAATADHRIEVKIDGVTRSGAPFPIAYAIDALRVPDEAACRAATAKLNRAKAKLKKLRRQDADQRRIDKVKQKVRAAREAVAAAC